MYQHILHNGEQLSRMARRQWVDCWEQLIRQDEILIKNVIR